MKTILFVRHNIDWRAMTMDKFMGQSLRGAPGDPTGNALRWIKKNRYILSIWNKTFRINYFDFRAKIKDLAETTFADIPVIRGPEQLREECLKDEDAYLAPIDDDDWISPKLEDVLSKQLTTVVAWGMGRTPGARSTNKQFSGYPKRFLSCNYAFRKSFIQQRPKMQRFLYYHDLCRRYARQQKLDCTTHWRLLTYTNKTLASLTTLYALWHKSRRPKKLEANMKRAAIKFATIRQFREIWTQEHFNKSAELHAQLLGPIYL
jgi:hypothetical protein